MHAFQTLPHVATFICIYILLLKGKNMDLWISIKYLLHSTFQMLQYMFLQNDVAYVGTSLWVIEMGQGRCCSLSSAPEKYLLPSLWVPLLPDSWWKLHLLSLCLKYPQGFTNFPFTWVLNSWSEGQCSLLIYSVCISIQVDSRFLIWKQCSAMTICSITFFCLMNMKETK